MGGKDRNFRIRLEKREKPGKGERKGQREKKDRHFCGKREKRKEKKRTGIFAGKSGKRTGILSRKRTGILSRKTEKDRHFEPGKSGKRTGTSLSAPLCPSLSVRQSEKDRHFFVGHSFVCSKKSGKRTGILSRRGREKDRHFQVSEKDRHFFEAGKETRKRTGTSLSFFVLLCLSTRKGQALLCPLSFFVSVAAVAFFLSPFSR